MQLNYSIRIPGAGTGSDATLGLVDGSLLWSVDYMSGWATGFIDQSALGDVVAACNILEGGELGGITSPVSLSAYGASLVQAVDAGTLQLQGRQLVLSVWLDGSETVLYSGTITKAFCPDRLTLQITSTPASSLDTRTIPFVTVTSEMTGNTASSAVGQTLSPIFGVAPRYPLLYVEPASTLAPIMLEQELKTDAGERLMYTLGWPYNKTPASYVTQGLEYKGLALLSVYAAWQQTEDVTPLWVSLCIDGKAPLFCAAAEASMVSISSALVGQSLVGAAGPGKGSYFRIQDVEWAEHQGLTGVWVQLDTCEASAVKAAAKYDPGRGYDDDKISDFRAHTDRATYDGDAWGETDAFKAAYNSGEVQEITALSFCSATNLFLLYGGVQAEGAKILSVGSDGTTEIKGATITTIYKSDTWQLVAIDSERDGSSFKVTDSHTLTTNFVYDLGSRFNGVRDQADSYDLTQNIKEAIHSATTFTSTKTVTNTTYKVSQYNSTYGVIDGPIDGVDLAKATTRLLPAFRFRIEGGWDIARPVTLDLELTATVMGEGNLALGARTARLKAKFQGFAQIYIELKDGVATLSGGCTTHPTTSTDVFEALSKGLDLTDLLSIADGRRIRGIVFSTNALWQMYGQAQGGGVLDCGTIKANKTVHPMQISCSKAVSYTSGLYLQPAYSWCTSPAYLIMQIADAAGIACDEDSFIALMNHQQKYLVNYNGSYAPTAGAPVSTVLQDIARQTLTGLYTDAAGVLHAYPVGVTPDSFSYAFQGTDLIDGSLSLSTNDTEYISSGFDFEAKLLDGTRQQVAINVQGDLPLANEYYEGDVKYNEANGFTITEGTVCGAYFHIRVRAASALRPMLQRMVPGTTWNVLTPTHGRYIATLTSVAMDPACPTGSVGVHLGFTTVSHDPDATGTPELCLYGAQPLWRDYVSGDAITSYYTAEAVYSSVKSAREYLGRIVYASSSSCKLTQPLWGSAVGLWVLYTARYLTTRKVIARFSTPLTEALVRLPLLADATLQWGKYNAAPVSGKVLEKTVSPSAGTISWTLCITGVSAAELGHILTEQGISITTETGTPLALEDATNPTGEKISALGASAVQPLLDAGGVIPVAIPGVATVQTGLGAVLDYAYTQAKAYTDAGAATVHAFTGGEVGDTSVTIPHDLGSKEYVLSVYDTLDNTTIPLGVTISKASFSITDLAPLTKKGQVKIVCICA